jgi:hypothetical protein
MNIAIEQLLVVTCQILLGSASDGVVIEPMALLLPALSASRRRYTVKPHMTYSSMKN